MSGNNVDFFQPFKLTHKSYKNSGGLRLSWPLGCSFLTPALAEASTLEGKMFISIEKQKGLCLKFKKFSSRHSTDSVMFEKFSSRHPTDAVMSEGHSPIMEK